MAMQLQLWTALSPQECRQRFSSTRTDELPGDVSWQFTEKGELELDPKIRGYRRKYVVAWLGRGSGAEILVNHKDPVSQRILFWFCQVVFAIIAVAGLTTRDMIVTLTGAGLFVGYLFLERWMQGVSRQCVMEFLHQALDAREEEPEQEEAQNDED